MMYELSLKRMKIGEDETNLLAILVIWDILKHLKSLLFQNSKKVNTFKMVA